MTTAELAEFLRIPAKTLKNWRAAGQGPPYLKIGRGVRYARRDVLAWQRTVRVETGPLR